ncbi:ribonuclease H-like domain-containing protein [Baaleninema simplex]|uniref:ribonuclease H-like domain-containing protein n=1 Tax=Baaleninema simplex TaxID=2862350 RepID=UPI000370139B|nr:ribonuclease H-like domain-containing protein [Baaleninema simplex]
MEQQNFKVFDRDLDDRTLDRYLDASELAIDTETMGLLPQRDRLCLVQLCDPSGFVSAVRIQRGQTDAPNLKRLLETDSSLKIFHYARFDVATLDYHLGIVTKPLFCTKIASKLARTYTSSHGLKALVGELEGVELDKKAQSSDWGNAANLSEEQLSYAANDVRYLIGLKAKLATMLKREDRWELAQRCFDCIPVFTALDLMQYQNIFEH